MHDRRMIPNHNPIPIGWSNATTFRRPYVPGPSAIGSGGAKFDPFLLNDPFDDAPVYGPRTAYNGYSGYHGDE